MLPENLCVIIAEFKVAIMETFQVSFDSSYVAPIWITAVEAEDAGAARLMAIEQYQQLLWRWIAVEVYQENVEDLDD
jgi:hypothetical protein